MFGQDSFLSKKLAKIVGSWEKCENKGDIPQSAERWEAQYLRNKWEFMGDLDECSRYSTIVGYISYLKPRGAILDVGCGEGILFEKYRPHGYSKYLGIDIAEAALSQVTQKQDEKTSFVKADAETFVPTEQFDVVVFNETLYYFDDPFKAVERYSRSLKKNGILIVSTYTASKRAMSILRGLKTKYSLLDETKTTHEATKKSWICSIFKFSHQHECTRTIMGSGTSI